MYLKLHGYSKPVHVQAGPPVLTPCPPFWPAVTILSGHSRWGRGAPWSTWKNSRRGLKRTPPLIFHSSVFSSQINLRIHEFILDSSPGGRKFVISLHEERAFLCPRANMMPGSQDVTCRETGLFPTGLLQRSVWSAGITSHLVPHLVSNLGCLAVLAWNHCSPHSWADRRPGPCRKPM